MRRFLRIGGIAGAIAGLLFAAAVISLADCAGPSCGRERVLGLLLHGAIGLVAGAVLGLVAHGIRRLVRGTS